MERIEVPIHDEDTRVAVLFDDGTLDRLKSQGVRVDQIRVHRFPNGKLKSPEVPWTVCGRSRLVAVSHIIHEIVGQRRRVQYHSNSDVVAAPCLDLRRGTHMVGEPGKRRSYSRKRKAELKSKYGVQPIKLFAATVERADGSIEVLNTFEDEDQAWAFIGRKLA